MDNKIDENQSSDDGNSEDLNCSKNEDGNGGKGMSNSENSFENDDEELGGIDIKRWNGEGSHMGGAKQAGMKRKVSQDDEPATATIAKRNKLNGRGAIWWPLN